MSYFTMNGTRSPIRHHRPDVRCFQRLDVPPEHQLSNVPEAGEQHVGYFFGAREASRKEVGGGGWGWAVGVWVWVGDVEVGGKPSAGRLGTPRSGGRRRWPRMLADTPAPQHTQPPTHKPPTIRPATPPPPHTHTHTHTQVFQLDQWTTAAPMALCRDNCGGRGSCVTGPNGEGPGQCRCHKGYQGPTCGEVLTGVWDNNCYSKCNGAAA
jgi:hypothetical protein